VAGLALLACVAFALVHFLLDHFIKGYKSTKIGSTTSSKRKKRGPVCLFSAETDFLVETAEDLPPTPLDLFESWINPKDRDCGKPLAARWLNAGLSGQDTPRMLRVRGLAWLNGWNVAFFRLAR
jgi:hypothetical protein